MGHEDDPIEETQAAFAARLRELDHEAWAELYDRHHTQIWLLLVRADEQPRRGR